MMISNSKLVTPFYEIFYIKLRKRNGHSIPKKYAILMLDITRLIEKDPEGSSSI